ncbi:MAG: putative drug exporter of the superfamily [Solirubrobacteraceae bacterium]|nr:putative drug exporter of the superfamily [Solirubrobacteraceae bacterium]
MSRLLTLAAGHRSKWVVAVVWIIVAGLAGSVYQKFGAAQKNDLSSYLPGDAESSRALAVIDRIAGGAQLTPAVVVFARAAKLKAADLAAVSADRRTLNARLPATGVPAPPGLSSRDGKAILLIFGLRTHGSGVSLVKDVNLIRSATARGPPGLVTKVAGPAGTAYDAAEVFKSVNGTLLLVTVGLIFVLLVLIYRSPIFWIVPLVAVGFAELTAEGIGYLLTRIGVTVTSESAAILTVLAFGAGTDYALLLVSRYREELYRNESRHRAMGLALGRSGPVIFASASTVILALLCLLAGEVDSTRGLGPIAGIGVAVAMLSSLTLLPALLLIVGRRAFWPFVPNFRGPDAEIEPGVWRRVARRVDGNHRPIALISTVLLAVMCVGVASLHLGLTSGNAFRGDVESTQGQRILAAHFPAGASEPAQVVVTDPRQLQAVRVAMSLAPGVAKGPLAVAPASTRAGESTFQVTLAVDPASQRAFDLVGSLRRIARTTAGTAALVGGPSAGELDLRGGAARDKKLIVPMILTVVFLILAALLRAVVAPLLLILTVLLSYGAAIGTGAFVFKHVFGYPGEDPSLELFTFLFLVALGVDYNIFLMARVREEALELGTRIGAIRALEVTGPVITSAGIVLAGTFSALASLPLIGFTELGFVIAFGVLLDTFLVRTVLVPALVIEFDRRIWWPSRLGRPAAADPTTSPDPTQADQTPTDPTPTPTAAPAQRTRRRSTPALVLAAAALGGLLAVAISHGGSGGHRSSTARSGSLTLDYAPPWRTTRSLAPGSFALAAAPPRSPGSAPVSLGSGRASLAAGRLDASALVPGGVPPALLARYGRPATQASIAVGAFPARRYSWQLHDGQVLVARIIPTAGSDLAILCASAKADVEAGQSCAGVAATAAIYGVALLPPGPYPQLESGLLAALKPVHAVRDLLGPLAPAQGAGLARLATQTAGLELVAATELTALPLPGRNRLSLTGLESALRTEAGRLDELAGVIAREPEQFLQTRARVILASVQVSAASSALLAEGFRFQPLGRLGSPGAVALAARAAAAARHGGKTGRP